MALHLEGGWRSFTFVSITRDWILVVLNPSSWHKKPIIAFEKRRKGVFIFKSCVDFWNLQFRIQGGPASSRFVHFLCNSLPRSINKQSSRWLLGMFFFEWCEPLCRCSVSENLGRKLKENVSELLQLWINNFRTSNYFHCRQRSVCLNDLGLKTPKWTEKMK